MVYQENKVFNLKLAAATLDHLLIRPGKPSPSGAWCGMPTGIPLTGRAWLR